MSLRLLDDSVRSSIRSGVAVSCISQCVEELVLNSIDAGAQSITVRIDVSKLFIQVTDNGTGVSYDDLQLLGERYATSKCHTLGDLSDLCFHGYRGEAVASIISCCGVVEFTSRHCLSSNTYCKIFHRGRSLGACPSRNGCSSIGTTVTVRDVFYNLPVRKKIICDNTECSNVRKMLAAIALIHPNVSFTLRNCQTSERLMYSKKTNSILSNFQQLFGTRLSLGLQEVSIERHGFKVYGCISTNSHYTKSYQFVYLNKRHIKHTRLHSKINHLLTNSLVARRPSRHLSPKSDQRRFIAIDSYGVFVLNIECMLSEFDITLEPAKTLVEFKRWDDVLSAIELVVTDFLKKNYLTIGTSPLGDGESPEDVSTSSSQVPQDVTYGLRSKTAQRIVLPLEPVNFASPAPLESISGTSPVQATQTKPPTTLPSPNVSAVTASAWIPGEEVSDTRPMPVSCSHVHPSQPHKKRKITVDENEGGCGPPLVGKDLVTQPPIIIQLDTPMRSPLNPITIASKLKGMNSGQRSTPRTLLSAAKRYGNRNKRQLWVSENTRGNKKRVVNDHQPSKNGYMFEQKEELMMETEASQVKVLKDGRSPKVATEIDSVSVIEKDAHCTPSGRTVATTYSFITPLSRDCHMADTCKDSTTIDGHVHNRDAQSLHISHNPVIKNICPLSKECDNDTSEHSVSDYLCGNFIVESSTNHSNCGDAIVDCTDSNFACLPCIETAQCVNMEDILVQDCEAIAPAEKNLPATSPGIGNMHQPPPPIPSPIPPPISPPISPDSVPVASSIGSTSTIGSETSSVLSKGSDSSGSADSTIISTPWSFMEQGCSAPVVSNGCTKSSCGPFMHSPLRAAPHLTYGFSPLKPRPKDARRSFDSGNTEELSSVDFCLPGSKWRDKAHSSVFSDWENPALSPGDVDVLNIGLSSERSSGIKIHSVIHPYKFTSDIFKNIQVLGQIDCKFIACLLKSDAAQPTTNRLLVFFDQHAVHERIRLETLTKGVYSSPGKISSIDVHPPQPIPLSEAEKKLTLIYKDQLEAVGVVLSHDGESVLVHSMPSVFSERDLSERRKGRSTVAMDLVQELVSKQIDLLCCTRGVCTTIPTTIQCVLSSQACHGAIKFGDPLTISECTELIQSLSSCNLPFQCAHGRPSLIPVLDLELLERRFPKRPVTVLNIKKLKMLNTN